MLKNISIRGAREHNLKNVDVEIPRDTLTVLTGLSGSGKSSLAFGIDGVESERGFARTRQAGQHRQRVAGNFHIDILEVVLAGTADGDVLQHRIYLFGFRRSARRAAEGGARRAPSI